jgi:hypothetical protein
MSFSIHEPRTLPRRRRRSVDLDAIDRRHDEFGLVPDQVGHELTTVSHFTATDRHFS